MAETSVNVEQEKQPRSKAVSGINSALLVIIIFLLVCNLGATGYLVYQFQQTSSGEIASANEPLPKELSSEQVRMALFENFRVLFNDRDNDNLYALFDPLAREEFTREQLDQQLPILYQIAGKINSGTYSYYEYSGISEGRKWFVLYYRIQTDNGIGTLKFTVAQRDQEPYKIWGFNISIG